MSLKDSISRGLDAVYESAVEKLDTFFGAAEVMVDTYLPDSEDVSVQAKANVLADYYESKGGEPETVANYRAGNVPSIIVAGLYAALVKFNPELAITEESGNKPMMTPGMYLEFLKKNYPTMATVYEQTLRNQERENNLRHTSESDEDEGREDLLMLVVWILLSLWLVWSIPFAVVLGKSIAHGLGNGKNSTHITDTTYTSNTE
jgi:hypothetical protein